MPTEPVPERETVLVLGASGFVGVAVVEALWSFGGDAGATRPLVVGASRKPAEAPLQPERTVAVDAADSESLSASLGAIEPQRILLLTALARGGACEADVDLARRLNAETPEVVARYAARTGARLVHVSTDLVFGGEAPPAGGFTEDEPPQPLSTYGRTKADGEARVLAAAPNALVVRLPLLCGNSRGRGLGASDAVVQAVEGGARPRLFTDEWRTPLDVDSAAAALVELVHTDERGVLHVAGPERLDRHTLGLLALQAAGRSPSEASALVEAVRQADVDTGAPRPSDVSLSAERARTALSTTLPSPRSSLGSN